MMRKNVETPNWLKMKEPREVRLAIEYFVQDLALMHHDLHVLFPDDLPSSRSSQSGSARSRPSTTRYLGAGSVSAGSQYGVGAKSERSIRSMFTKKMNFVGPVEMSRNSIITSVIRLALKVLIQVMCIICLSIL